MSLSGELPWKKKKNPKHLKIKLKGIHDDMLWCTPSISHYDSQVRLRNRNEARYVRKKKKGISHKFLLINLRSPLPWEKKHKVIFSSSSRQHSFVWLWNKGYSSQLGSRAMWQVLGRGGFGHRNTLSLLCQTSPPCVYYKQRETSHGDYRPLLSPLWSVSSWTSESRGSERACFYSSALAVRAERYLPHYLQKLIWVQTCSLSPHAGSVGHFLLASSHGRHTAEHLLIEEELFFSTEKHDGQRLYCGSNTQHLFPYVNQLGYWSLNLSAPEKTTHIRLWWDNFFSHKVEKLPFSTIDEDVELWCVSISACWGCFIDS